MTEETFWELIDTLDGVIDDDSIDLLTERLSSLSPEDVEGFCARLAAEVRRLAELPLEGRPVPDVSDAGHVPLPLGGDARENLLYAIVASGKAEHEAVISDPSVVEEKEWHAGDAELLIDAAATSLWTAAGVDWFDEFDPLLAPFRDDERWYETLRGSAWKSMPGAYSRAAHELDQRLNESEEWIAWWGQTSLRKIKIGITVNCDRNQHKIERGKDIARAKFEMDRSYFADRDPAALRRLVSGEAAHIMSTIARQLRMTPPPALPPL